MLNPYEQYKQTSVNTMTKGELLLSLFDGAIKKLNQSKILMDNNEYEQSRVLLEKCREIFNYLIITLDYSYEMSNELKEMYSFFNREIVKAIFSRKTKPIEDILPLVRDYRDTWEQADKLARTSKN
ncbi:flagellar protein FliS [Sedimentibacter acidaminivorans]|uniref:Flagellar protein FliS n=1 Tax=Sedimentibacter acidaminivorans TaxID=913099 RepID=A0ABS4GDF1_9FIRM|nr:flagellar export chaperone FliS [Sedimentibacter acidaminivorans]MBP1925716.1 flagellar protein FliS [Sedimentibacter acidaminivorans]